MFSLFLKGGPVMLLLLGCSIYGLYIAIERILYFRNLDIDEHSIVNDIQSSITAQGKENTIQALKSKKLIMISIVADSLGQMGNENVTTEDLVESAQAKLTPHLNQNLSMLSSLITVAPILGLLGTVLGLIDIFNVISGGGIGDAGLLSQGIAEALITTVTGLMITIPLIFIYNYLNDKSSKILLVLERLILSLKFISNS